MTNLLYSSDLISLSKKPNPPNPPIKPRIVLSPREKIRLEREMLKVYVSGHPLDEIQSSNKVISIEESKELKAELLV